MRNGNRKIILVLVMVFTLAGTVGLLIFKMLREFSTPDLETMSPVVEEPIESILRTLENELVEHRPETAFSLRPGIGLEELEVAQTSLGQTLHPEMQALYRWHNGLENDDELFPGYGFWGLESAVQTNQDLQRQGLYLLLPHEKDWLILFPDAAGDGYYYDPHVSYQQGGIFYVFREAGYYRYFPSVKNLLMAVVECYQNGAYPQDAEPNYELEEIIMDKYGVVYEQP
jgi:hypothetical protein